MPVPPVVASIVYWRNYTEDDNTYVEDKTTPSILSIETVGFEAPTGYEFQEWNTARDGSGYSMSAGDAPAASKVYAIWKEVAQDPYYLTKESELTSVANAIRTKGGTSAPLAFPAGFVSAINAISGGGASNVVLGTFAGDTDGEKLAISTNYSGSGYPVALLIYSSGGVSSQGGVFYLKIKRNTTVPPKYVRFSDEDYGLLSFIKPSKTNTSFAVFMFYASGPSGNDNLGAVFTDNTTLGVCISNSNNLFVTGQTYSYVIAYSE